MRRFLLLTISLMLASLSMAQVQIRVPNSRVSFEFPGNDWKFLETINVDATTTVYLYSYKGRVIIDKQSDTVLPNLRIYVRTGYKQSIYDLITDRYMQQPFQSMDEYSQGLPGEGIGYIGAHQNTHDGKYYKFRMIYFKDNTTAFEFRITTTRDTYDDMAEEFESIIKSVKIES